MITILHNFILIFIFFGISLSCYADSSLDSVAFKKLMDRKDFKGVILDIRTPDEWNNTGIIPGAITKNFKDADFKTFLKSLNTKGQYFIYCHSGGRSAKAIKIMTNMNLKAVDLHEGISGWLENKFPTKKIKP